MFGCRLPQCNLQLFYIRNGKIVKNVYLPFNDCFFTLEFPGCFF
ncbi:hypothetical protein HMPREF9444_01257 [Succinatimonas hippei YIT 12066]|uniref:Uncharacterized protein n=1 Tax=Succinatimonas hippei (strain DSM 22608 / JCM 16073 / KCTC 15190 / YIT 12066) TaxID=762983 RepID=E8LKL6_SUCHY|nr:hypothetical protein HMPREF9444_01257 [Succinatimonas hippei YIT 12066]